MNNTTNWAEFFSAFGGFCALVIAALSAAWVKIQNARLKEIKSDTAAAKDHAAAAAETVKESREERGEQFARMEGKADAAFHHANSTNDKIERQNSEILSLRTLCTELSAKVAALSVPAPPPPPAAGEAGKS